MELASGMYVHGGNDDENLFMIDGTPLYQINHTMGLFFVQHRWVKNVDFYKSGFPHAMAAGSSVVDVRPPTATCTIGTDRIASVCWMAVSNWKVR